MAAIKSGALYKVEFLLTEDKRRDPHTDLNNTNKEQELQKTQGVTDIANKAKEKKSMLNISGKAAAGTALALSTFAYNHSMNDSLNNLALQGDSIAARNLQHQRKITNELTGVGATLAFGAAMGPVGLAVAGGAIATKYLIQTINHQQDIRHYENQKAVNEHISRQNRSRIQLNSREFR